MKLGKAPGIDGVPVEGCRCCTDVAEYTVELLGEMWGGGDTPDVVGIMLPLFKKGENLVGVGCC